MLDDAAVRDIVREELARNRKREPFTGIVSATDPLTVTLNSGGDVHIAHRAPGLTLAQGDMVAVRFTGEGYQLASKLLQPDTAGALDFPDHNHDASYSLLGHTHTTGWVPIEHIAATGSSNTLSGTLSATYEHFRLSCGLYGNTSGLNNLQFRFNSDGGTNYNIQRIEAQGATWQTPVVNRATTTVFFRCAGAKGHAEILISATSDQVVGAHINYRARATAVDNDNVIGMAWGEYEAGPATSWSIVNNTGTFGSASEVDVYGIRMPS